VSRTDGRKAKQCLLSSIKAPRKDCQAAEKFSFYLPGIFVANNNKRIIRVITSWPLNEDPCEIQKRYAKESEVLNQW
jgi:hypothetical protein